MTVARVPSRMNVPQQLVEARHGEKQTAAFRDLNCVDAGLPAALAIEDFDP